MEIKKLIDERVHSYYWDEDLNCATTMLKILAEIFDVSLSKQVLDAAVGMHGAGYFQAQCGLVEGALMFLGIYGKEQGLSEEEIVDNCYYFASKFEEQFESLVCKELRPEGFKPDDPPHLCEGLSKNAVLFTANYIFADEKIK